MTENFSTNRRNALKLAGLALASTTVISRTKPAQADLPRVLADGALPDDKRLGKLKDLDGYFPWQPSPSIDEWKKRAEYVRRQLLVANGLWPMPTKHPLNPIVHGRVERDDFTVDRVILQTGEGLYCTGSLYRPKTAPKGMYPAVLCPHGHWLNGRFYEHTEADFQKELASGAESLPSGKYPLQARCVQLARMGCVVFHYDMLGYADSAPISFQLAHGFKKQRPELSSRDKWGLFSAQSELRCLSIVGLQTWNSIRALDWVSSLEDVDTSRIGVTGASGGGTQTFLLGAVDDRPGEVALEGREAQATDSVEPQHRAHRRVADAAHAVVEQHRWGRIPRWDTHPPRLRAAVRLGSALQCWNVHSAVSERRDRGMVVGCTQ